MDEILNRLDTIEGHLIELLRLAEPHPESDWLTSDEFCQLVGLRNAKALTYQMAKGIFTPKSVKNIGTAQRPRYRFHRTMAVNEFMNRSIA